VAVQRCRSSISAGWMRWSARATATHDRSRRLAAAESDPDLSWSSAVARSCRTPFWKASRRRGPFGIPVCSVTARIETSTSLGSICPSTCARFRHVVRRASARSSWETLEGTVAGTGVGLGMWPAGEDEVGLSKWFSVRMGTERTRPICCSHSAVSAGAGLGGDAAV
jgi:hypothetical protein